MYNIELEATGSEIFSHILSSSGYSCCVTLLGARLIRGSEIFRYAKCAILASSHKVDARVIHSIAIACDRRVVR